MTGRKKYTVLGLLLVMLMLAVLPITAMAAKNTGLQQIDGQYYYFDKSGKKIKKQFKTVKKNIYYFKKNGKAAIGWLKLSGKKYYFDGEGKAAKGLTKIGKKVYYFSDSGVMQTGWKSIGKKWAYFNKKNGVMIKGAKVDNIKIKPSGFAAPTAVQKKQLKAQEKADEVVQSITKNSMSNSQKLRVCYDYITSKRFHYIRKGFYAYKGWEYDYGYEMLTKRGGNCYNFACAFALMAKSIGYEPYVIRGMVPRAGGGTTPHGLVKISGKFYDPEGQWAGWATGVYGRSSYPMSLSIQATTKI